MTDENSNYYKTRSVKTIIQFSQTSNVIKMPSYALIYLHTPL